MLYKQNKAACPNIQYGKRESKLPTERSRDVDIQNFAIQEWQQRRDRAHTWRHQLSGRSDQASPLGGRILVHQHRHVCRRIMGLRPWTDLTVHY
jgi:hypothetical protein